jgi:hypothetical protein
MKLHTIIEIIFIVNIGFQYSCSPPYKRYSDNKDNIGRNIQLDSMRRAQEKDKLYTQCPDERISYSNVIGLSDSLFTFLNHRILGNKPKLTYRDSLAKTELDSEIIKLEKQLEENKKLSTEMRKNFNQKEHLKVRYYIDSCSLSHFDSLTIIKVKQFVTAHSDTFSIQSSSRIDGVDTVFGNVLSIGFNDHFDDYDGHFIKKQLPNIQFIELVYFNGRYSSGTLWLYILKKNSDSTFKIIENRVGGYLD